MVPASSSGSGGASCSEAKTSGRLIRRSGWSGSHSEPSQPLGLSWISPSSQMRLETSRCDWRLDAGDAGGVSGARFVPRAASGRILGSGVLGAGVSGGNTSSGRTGSCSGGGASSKLCSSPLRKFCSASLSAFMSSVSGDHASKP